MSLCQEPWGPDRLKELLNVSDNIVLLKTYRHKDSILETLEELGLLDRATCISRCGLDGEIVVRDVSTLKGQSLPYLSMLIVKKKGTCL